MRIKCSVIKLDLLVGIALILTGLLTRLPYVAFIPLFDDETTDTLYSLTIKPGEFMPLVNIDPYNGPMFSYILAASLHLFPSPVTPRIVVMIMGALTVGVTFWLARALGLGRPWAALAGLLMATNPLHIVVNSHLASSSYIVPLFSTAFLAALVLAVKRESGPWLIAAGVLLGLTGQAHPVAALMLPGVAIWFLFQLKPSIGFRTRWPYLALAVCVLICAPLIIHNVRTPLAAVREVAHSRVYAWEPVTSLGAYGQNMARMALQLGRQVSGVLDGTESFGDLAGLPLLFIAWAVAGLVYAARKGVGLLALAVVSQLLIMPGLTRYYGLLLPTRYTSHLIPLIFVAMAALVEGLWNANLTWRQGVRSNGFSRLGTMAEAITANRVIWLIGALLVVISLLPLASLGRYYQHQLPVGRTTAPYYAFFDEVMQKRRGERILISDSLGRFNPTEYLFATNRVPYLYQPLGRIMERLATGQESGSVILIVDKEDLVRVQSQTNLIAWDSPVMQASHQRGYGAYTIADARQVRKPAFVFTDTTLAPTVRPMQANLADQLALIGYEPKATRFAPGHRFTVNLYWKVIATMPESYTGFLHLTGPDGRLVAQDDHELGRGFYRTIFWQRGEIVRERYELALPKNIPPGSHAIWAGVYGFPSFKRLAVRSASTLAQDDRVWLDAIHVEP